MVAALTAISKLLFELLEKITAPDLDDPISGGVIVKKLCKTRTKTQLKVNGIVQSIPPSKIEADMKHIGLQRT